MSTIIERQQNLLRETGLDMLISVSPESVAYTSGVFVPTQTVIRSRHAICVVPAKGDPVMIVVDIEESYVRSLATIADIRSYNEFTQNPIDLLTQAIKGLGVTAGRIAIELDYLPAQDFLRLREMLPNVEFLEAKTIFDRLKMIKTEKEIALLEKLGQAAEASIKETFAALKPGMTETDIASGMVQGFLGRGGERISILAVGAGPRSSFLNCPPAGRKLEPGDIVRVDLIGSANGYFSDVARTGVVGKPTKEQKAIWEKIVRAHDAVIELIKPGVHTKKLYDFYRDLVTQEGLTPINFVGHGLGLTLHEEPYIGRYGGCVLEEGMVLCVEPIHIVENTMGFQLENVVLVTKSGARCLTGSITGKELLVVS